MAHPTQAFPKGFYDINKASVTATESFYAITCYGAGNIEVQGGGRFEHVTVSTLDDAGAAKYIDPSTGVPFASDEAADTAGNGFYEKISTEKTTVALTVGQTIYGDFTAVSTPATGQAKVLAHFK